MSDFTEQRSLRADIRILWQLLLSPVRGDTHAERLESFYGRQAADYDSFRARMLHGRNELMSWINFPAAAVWVDMGAGTGHNFAVVSDRLDSNGNVHLVDLSKSLLEVARHRVRQADRADVQFHHADATLFELPNASVDVVTFCYSLTMIPDWFEAISVAERILKPGGTIAVADFYVSRKYALQGSRQHPWLSRTFWSLWFAADNVFLSGDHLAMLRRRFDCQRCEESLGSVPYLPLLRAPYYLFLGRKPASAVARPQ